MLLQRVAALVVRFKEYVVLVALLLASVGLMQLGDPLRIPGLQMLTVVGLGVVQAFAGTALNPFVLKRENELLQQLNTELMLEVMRLQRARAENERLRQLLGIRTQLSYELIPGEVVGLSVGQLRAYATLDKGAIDGVRPGMPVVSAAGLLGSVRAVSSRFAVVELLENREVRVAVRLQASGAEGILVWGGEVGKFLLRYIPTSVPVQAGERVVTSASSDRFPPDLLVGVVQEVQREHGLPFHRIIVIPTVPYQVLRHVIVLRHVPNPERRLLEEKFFTPEVKP
ncbi:MAG: rod shape-determining protein MreC [Candidatus Kapabacteria bacterium]|nr:rod shape-determining protein MreC [Candidatus Kapabacteria bacterium]MDW8225436.1 rod shape-determining protein MreC [Bacteroidota bacterium]